MLTYVYQARNPVTGEKVKALVQADDEKAASNLIKKQGLSLIDLRLDRKASGITGLRKKIKTKDKVLFSRQLATLINAGLPLLQSLRSVAQQTTSKPLKSIINEVIIAVEGGKTLSSTLEKYPKVFDRLFISMVAAGETSGTLDKSLERLANQQEKDSDILSKVRGAMIYPGIVLLVMIAVVIFMITIVLPQVQNIYSSLPGVSLPIETRLLLAVAHFIINYWWIVIILIVASALTFRWYRRTLAGRKVIDTVKMHTWPFNHLFMKLYMSRFARTANTLVASGVPILQVMEITADAIGNVNISQSLLKAKDKVKTGKALSEAISNDPNFLDLVPNMIRIGEQSGAIESMLDRVALYYEKEVDNEIKNISTLIEPVLMIIMGVVALTIVAAILLPIYGLVSNSTFTSGI